MVTYVCTVCGFEHSDSNELPDDWACPVCGASKALFNKKPAEGEPVGHSTQLIPSDKPKEQDPSTYLKDWERPSDDTEDWMKDIHEMAQTGHSIHEPMRTKLPVVSWGDILIKGAQLNPMPLAHDADVSTKTIIGKNAARPMELDTPVMVSHMSYGALSKEAKMALAKGSGMVGTGMCSGEGGILPESRALAHKYIFEYVPNQYSVTEENLRNADAIEIKIGQSAKPGMGGHLPGNKVTDEIAAVRGREKGLDIISPSSFSDIQSATDLKTKVDWLRERSGGRPIGIKMAAGNIEADLEFALSAGPDFITFDGRAGATGSAPKHIKAATSVPTIHALHRARKFLDANNATVDLIITGGLRVSSDMAKALAMGADAVAIASAAMMAIGCQQYRMCNSGKCPMGIATQEPELRKRLNIDQSAQRLANYLTVCTEELKTFARITGNADVHGLNSKSLFTTNSEISNHTNIEHA
ncbi:Glutamate synthase [NADPH] large chain [Pontiella desulfatans]|uniref:Glutamate synthase [NADPH] large chain n=1 Tax=Pontiella desulfatans TaxID=2750659 RepID=A0A6C2UCI2_PONDE|nr:glutamate synthase-related protein [Pontiella desulfatans]VGO17815.1 Glutamate synthase [NADPH] large chain [Pontiella desulfatans]